MSVTAVLIVAVLGTLAYDQFYSHYLRENWQSIAGAEERRTADEIQSTFRLYRDESAEATRRIAALPDVRTQLLKGDSLSQTALFRALLPHSRQDVSVEIYDRTKRLVAWAGYRGPGIDPQQIAEQESSFVQDGPLYSYLVISIPVIADYEGKLVGFVIGKRLVDVTYPINNRFINNQAFTSTFAARLEVSPRFDFSEIPALKQDQTLLPVGLPGLGGAEIGWAYIPRRDLATRLDEVHELARHVLNLLLVGAVLLVSIVLYRWRRFGEMGTLVVRSLLLWVFRYLLIVINFPAGYFKWGMFDSVYFASPFGSGLAKSIGDLCITSLVLLCNVLLVVAWIIRSSRRPGGRADVPSRGARLFAACSLPLLTLLVCLFLRGFAALIHSAMFDSDLEYNDPSFIIPSMELAAMQIGLILAAVSLALAGSGVMYFCGQLAGKALGNRGIDLLAWSLVAAVVVGVSLLFGALQDNPLPGQGERIIYLLGLTGLAVFLSLTGKERPAVTVTQYGALVVVAAILALIPRLDTGAHALDRTHTELLGNEIAQPGDSWLSLVANQALDELAGQEASQVLASADSDDIEKLAFTKWAHSILSREGYNCTVIYVDTTGNPVSDFHIGTPLHQAHSRRYGAPRATRSLHVEEKSAEGATVKWYIGYAPVRSDSGNVVGGVRVELTGGRQAMLRGEAPVFLRSHSRENFERHYRTLILSEYFQGKLISTTSETIPLDRTIPDTLRSLPADGSGIWLDEEIEGANYETYFLRERPGGGSNGEWLALSLEDLGLRWHLYSFLRYGLFFGLLGGAVLLVTLAIRWLRGWRFALTFRSKLLAAFVVVSLIPVGILAYYNRQYASERMRENTDKWLSNQTSIVVAEIQRQMGISLPVVLSQLTDAQCSDIAGDLNTDFVVYRGTSLQASSKPEMFDAELLDRNLSAESYLNSVLRKKSFYAEDQMIGNLPYVVGYRPIVAENGSIIGVAAVPTLYRQTEVNAELTRRNVFLYGACAVALLFSFVVGTIFAGQISSPIRRLKKATQQVGGGSLDVDLASHSKDELGDLEQAFRDMVRDLRQTQEQMLRGQRELAWREMAKQIAHEIKNPLTPMKLSIQHLRRAYSDGAKDFANILASISETLLVQIETLSKIATEFSTFARMPARTIEECDVHEVLAEARNLFSQDSNITFRNELLAGPVLVHADREELRRVFINILRNSVQAMEAGGTISLSTRRDGGTLLIKISDNGPGISAEARSRLFEPNFSTKTDGMGLGLAIVKKIIDDLGGNIAIESTSGEGTLVTIRLPLVAGSNPAERSNDTLSGKSDG